MMDLNLKLQATSTKSLAKAIDFELRKEHAVEAEEQLNIVKVLPPDPYLIQAYLPEAFESERSSIQGLLRFKRLSFKARILRTFLVEQHTATADPKSKPASFDADHAIARTLVLEQLVQIQSLTSRFAQYFSKCNAKEFEGASAIFHELDPVEKGLDRWLASLRSGEMNERACSESLHGLFLL
jgi:dynactin 1